MIIESELPPLSILLVSPEYPPMPGGIGRYTYNLKKRLVELGFTVSVVCDERGEGEYSGISQHNPGNSRVLLELVEKLGPDLIHVQYEPGLYGLKLDMLNPRKSSTNIDTFYEYCRIPIITTFHSAYPFKQWMSLPIPVNEYQQKEHHLIRKVKGTLSFWTRLINYYSFRRLNEQKLAQSAAGIAFSEFTSRLIGNSGKCHVIFHGAEKPDFALDKNKSQLRELFSIPKDRRVALALGYATKTKGWDVIEKMEIPDGWTVVMNASKNEYNHEVYQMKGTKKNVLVLDKDFLSEEQLCALFSCADAVLLPYKVGSGSGIMFDGLAYGLPFLATNLGFFDEYASRGLGITVKRSAEAFSKALLYLDEHYEEYSRKVDAFNKELLWQQVANEHAKIYRDVPKRREQNVPLCLSTEKKKKILVKNEQIQMKGERP
jgi:glycosyltransferase involved in cell wall biosynthesis